MVVFAISLVAALCIGAASATTPIAVNADVTGAGPVVDVNETVNVTIIGATLGGAATVAGAASVTTTISSDQTTVWGLIDTTGVSAGNTEIADLSGTITDDKNFITVTAVPTLTITPPSDVIIGTNLTAEATFTEVTSLLVSYNDVPTTLGTSATAVSIGKAEIGKDKVQLIGVNGVESFGTPVETTITLAPTATTADISNFTAVPNATEIAKDSPVTIDINATKQLTTFVWLSWGDGTIELLDFTSDINLSKSHTYALADTSRVIVMNGQAPDQSTGLKTVSTITVTKTAGAINVDMQATAPKVLR